MKKQLRERRLDAEQKKVDALAPFKYACRHCGRKMIIGYNNDRRLCDHCGHYIYKNDQLEFKYKVLEEMKKKGI